MAGPGPTFQVSGKEAKGVSRPLAIRAFGADLRPVTRAGVASVISSSLAAKEPRNRSTGKEIGTFRGMEGLLRLWQRTDRDGARPRRGPFHVERGRPGKPGNSLSLALSCRPGDRDAETISRRSCPDGRRSWHRLPGRVPGYSRKPSANIRRQSFLSWPDGRSSRRRRLRISFMFPRSGASRRSRPRAEARGRQRPWRRSE